MRFKPLSSALHELEVPARRHFFHRSSRWLLAGAALTQGGHALASVSTAPHAPRHLAMNHTHTRESVALVYAVGPDFVPQALQHLNHFLRDHYSGDVGQMDPQLFHLMHLVRRELETDRPFHIISGYRSPRTNERLRTTRGGGVAKRSLHMEGRAVDIRLPGVPLADVRDAARDLKLGGVGYYPGEQFIHLDTGRVRSWGG